MKMNLFVSLLAVSVLAACSNSSGGGSNNGGGDGVLPSNAPNDINVTIPLGEKLSAEAIQKIQGRFQSVPRDFELEDWIFEDEEKPARQQTALEKKWVQAVTKNCNIQQPIEKQEGSIQYGDTETTTTTKSIDGQNCPVQFQSKNVSTVKILSRDDKAGVYVMDLTGHNELFNLKKSQELVSDSGFLSGNMVMDSKARAWMNLNGESTMYANANGQMHIFLADKSKIDVGLKFEVLGKGQGSEFDDKSKILIHFWFEIEGYKIAISALQNKDASGQSEQYFLNGYPSTKEEIQKIFLGNGMIDFDSKKIGN